mgnify:CR=1 FL=1
MLARATVDLHAANGALALLGEARLTSLDEDRPAARAITDAFGNVRDALLRRHPWNFALRYRDLTLDPSLPAGSFANGFPLPSDCLRVRSVDGLGPDAWTVEAPVVADPNATVLAPVLYCDATAARIAYTASIVHVALWDSLFLEVFELELAARIAGVVGQSGLADNLRATASARLSSARRVDEREAARSRVTSDVSFLRVRR